MMRRLAQEALKKIDGDMHVERQKQIASEEKPHAKGPTDQKLSSLRELDKKLSDWER
jgi:hypothetical protein